MNEEITTFLTKLQPFYEELYKKFSSAYLHGCEWYVGINLVEWWSKQDKIYIDESRKKVEMITLNVMNNKNL